LIDDTFKGAASSVPAPIFPPDFTHRSSPAVIDYFSMQNYFSAKLKSAPDKKIIKMSI